MVGKFDPAPSPEARAIAASSIKASITGTIILTLFVLSTSVVADEVSVSGLLTSLWVFGLVFMVAFVAGAIGTGLILLLFGAAIARLSRDFLAAPWGLLVAIGSAAALSLCISALFANSGLAGSAWLAAIILGYAAPAAIIYRREILLEQSLG